MTNSYARELLAQQHVADLRREARPRLPARRTWPDLGSISVARPARRGWRRLVWHTPAVGA